MCIRDRLITTAASIVNGGNRVTPHFGVETVSADGTSVHKLDYPSGGRILSEETSATMRYVLEQVVSEGSGKKAKLEGYRIGGKTATSEKLPRSLKKYISSFIGFAPADNPQVMALITIDAVSYTHLDVYKRQAKAPDCSKAGDQAGETIRQPVGPE